MTCTMIMCTMLGRHGFSRAGATEVVPLPNRTCHSPTGGTNNSAPREHFALHDSLYWKV